MLSAKEALNKLLESNPTKKPIEGIEYDSFFAFALVDKKMPDDALIGGGYLTVDKQTGDISGISSVKVAMRNDGDTIDLNEIYNE